MASRSDGVNEPPFFRGNPLPWQRVYHIHLRKTGGTSINRAFLRMSGMDPGQLYELLVRRGRFEAKGIRYTAWRKALIEGGQYDYAYSHRPLHSLRLPPDTYTFTILRDPVQRVVSHYRMLLEMQAQTPRHPGFHTESCLLRRGFDGFIQRAPDEVLMGQFFIFSPLLDAREAVDRLASCSRVLFLEEMDRGLKELEADLGVSIPYAHERKANVDFTPSEKQAARLRQRLAPEYEMIDGIKSVLVEKSTQEPTYRQVISGKLGSGLGYTVRSAQANRRWRLPCLSLRWFLQRLRTRLGRIAGS